MGHLGRRKMKREREKEEKNVGKGAAHLKQRRLTTRASQKSNRHRLSVGVGGGGDDRQRWWGDGDGDGDGNGNAFAEQLSATIITKRPFIHLFTAFIAKLTLPLFYRLAAVWNSSRKALLWKSLFERDRKQHWQLVPICQCVCVCVQGLVVIYICKSSSSFYSFLAEFSEQKLFCWFIPIVVVLGKRVDSWKGTV